MKLFICWNLRRSIILGVLISKNMREVQNYIRNRRIIMIVGTPFLKNDHLLTYVNFVCFFLFLNKNYYNNYYMVDTHLTII